MTHEDRTVNVDGVGFDGDGCLCLKRTSDTGVYHQGCREFNSTTQFPKECSLFCPHLHFKRVESHDGFSAAVVVTLCHGLTIVGLRFDDDAIVNKQLNKE